MCSTFEKIQQFRSSCASYIRTAVAGTLLLVFGSILFLFLGLCMLVPLKYRHNKFLYWILYLSYRVLSYSLFLPLCIRGKRNLITNQPVIIAANHQSALDIPLLGMLVGTHPHVWLVLEHYVHKPFLGLLIKKFFVSVDKEKKVTAAKSLVKLLQLANTTQGHIIIFPEGGRFADGTIHPFFAGFALLAQKTGRPVVPVFMPYNGIALYPEKLLLSYAPLKIIIGKPFMYEIDDTRESFTERVYLWFVAENNKFQSLS